MNYKKIGTTFLKYLVLSVVAIVMIFPFLWILSSSLKTLIGISEFPPRFFPREPQWENYSKVFTSTNIMTYAKNTIIIIIGNVFGTLLSSAIVAYPLARMEFKGKNVIFAMILATMMVPATTTIIPQYFIFSKIGWLNSLKPLIVPAFFAYPYNVFLIRQFYRSIPKSLDEAAIIDGCNQWQILTKIIMPLSKSTYITIGVLAAISWWNELFIPLIYIDSDNLKTLVLGALTSFKQASFVKEWNMTMAMSMVMIIPPITLYLVANKYLVEGVKTSGMKN